MHRPSLAVSAFIASVVFPVVFPALALAAADFRQLPGERPRSPSGLQIRVVRYDGSTNGSITVDVKNPTAEPQLFTAKGLFFVPQGNADTAPQRLGAVGPFRSANGNAGNAGQRQDRMAIPPGATERVSLDVYCIDSHRPSPNSKTPFRTAAIRMPDKLTEAIDGDARKSTSAYGGVSSAHPSAKAAIQSEVWKNRDAKWIKLDGEGKQEAGK